MTTGLRKTHVTVNTAVNKMLAEIIDQKLAFLLPKTMALEYINNLHYQCKISLPTQVYMLVYEYLGYRH